ncbi:tyrosine-type recombinase/integrase [Luteolibacter rhizosphaerae]|nr:site-specific integrase [Luteolibacter rhizosphaerae]
MEAAVKWEELAIEYGFRGFDHFCTEKFAELEKGAKSPKLSVLLNAFVSDNRKNWSDQYLGKRWKPFRRRLLDLEDETISHMNEEFWRAWMAAWAEEIKPSSETYNQQLGMVRSLFELSLAKKVFQVNPLENLVGAKERVKRAVPVSSPEDVLKLLLAAWEHDRELVPYFATCYFAGVRPDSEAKELRFEHYDWKEGHLKVGITKTNHLPHRYVPIEDALRAWMQPFMRKKGSIIPSNFKKRRRRLIYGGYTTPGAKLSNEATWKPLVIWGHDITRHSYGSYWEGLHRGEAGSREKIVANMGHEDFKTFDRYYKNTRTRKEAEAYWDIRPPASASKVISIA